MILNDTALIALSVCTIVFPTFIIIPAAFGIVKRLPYFWFTALYTGSFLIAGLSLLAAAIYTAISLFSQHSAINSSLGTLVILLAIGALYYLYVLQQWLWELALLDILSEAEAKEQ
jgi:hypothetical protein